MLERSIAWQLPGGCWPGARQLLPCLPHPRYKSASNDQLVKLCSYDDICSHYIATCLYWKGVHACIGCLFQQGFTPQPAAASMQVQLGRVGRCWTGGSPSPPDCCTGGRLYPINLPQAWEPRRPPLVAAFDWAAGELCGKCCQSPPWSTLQQREGLQIGRRQITSTSCSWCCRYRPHAACSKGRGLPRQ